MVQRKFWMWVGLLAGVSCAAAQSTFVETFENGSNVGGWTFGSSNGLIEAAGGNPGAYFHDPFLDSFAPGPRTTEPSIFTGNYRLRGVTSLGIDLILHDVDITAEGRPLALILINFNKTPDDVTDDWGAYFIGQRNVPLPGQGWVSYDFPVASDSPTLPPGWQFIQFGPQPPGTWDRLITQVDRVVFFYGDPTMFFIFQVWDLGMDNPRITWQPPCPGDLTGDSAVDLTDLSILLGSFGTPAGALPEQGDIDGDGDVDLADLSALLSAFGVSCG